MPLLTSRGLGLCGALRSFRRGRPPLNTASVLSACGQQRQPHGARRLGSACRGGLCLPGPWVPGRRQAAVVAAMRASWGAYETYAMGHDELRPLSRAGKDDFGGLGATVVDSLDTLWMLGLKAEFARARAWVANELTFNRRAPATASPAAAGHFH